MNNTIRSFYSRSIFDRIIIYLFLSEFLVKVIFELFLGQWWYIQSQNKQWFFYSFMAIDYLVSARRIIGIKFPLNVSTAFALLLFIMCGQAIVVGIMQHNRPFVIFNDAVPLLVMALNILRMQSAAESRLEPDFDFVLKSCLVLVVGCSVAGGLGQAMGLMTQPSMGISVIFLPLIAAAIFKRKSLSRWVMVLAAVLVALSMEDLNRSSLAFMATAGAVYFFAQTIRNPARGAIVIAITLPFVAGVAYFIPEDSKTYNRVMGLSEIDLSRRTGSIGERQAEQEAVSLKLKSLGFESELFGLGFGGVYSLKTTHEFVPDYGHAHYGWVWFNLRFGVMGYIYLAIMMSTLLLIAIRSFRVNSENGYFVGFLCFIDIIYVFTFVNAIFVQCGLPFQYLRQHGQDRKAPVWVRNSEARPVLPV